VLKLGIAAAWFTALVSAERFALEDVPELLADVPVLCGAELELELELLDEHAASSTAAPAAAAPNATRDARRFRLPVVKLVELLKRFMRPRICHKRSD
jgi:hypothetical protein